jgi:hypothetical protein
MISWLRHLIGWFSSVFRSREDLILENLALRQQLSDLRARRPRRRVSALQKFLDSVAKALGWLEKAAHPGHTSNSGWLASYGVSPVLAAHLSSA